jgi:hypothetical protein
MPSDLLLNPYAVLAVENEGTGDCIFVAPKIGEGLQILTISESEHPALYALLAELSKVGLNLLDVENDLDDRERDLFTRFGVLVTMENTPQKPLFSCLLDDVKTGRAAGDESSLRVNPTFRFEPFDLSCFRALSIEKHFSPYLPTAWIKSPGVELDLGYWVNHEQASILSNLQAGEGVPADIDPDFRAKLIAAGIIIDSRSYRENEENAASRIEEAKELFSQQKYATLQNVIPDRQIRAMQVFYREYIEQGFMMFGDTRVKRRFRQGNEPLARFFHLSLTPLMSKLVGSEVKPSYCYAASYREGADLKPHVDREACEYSFSLQIDYEPAPVDGVSPWPLCLSTRKLNKDHDNRHSLEWSDFPPNEETERAVHLRNGDCLAYRGRELAHYRSPLPEGHKSTSLFFHYVPMDFDGALT